MATIKITNIIKIVNNSGKDLSYKPYRQNFIRVIKDGDTLELRTSTPEASLFYYKSILPTAQVTMEEKFDKESYTIDTTGVTNGLVDGASEIAYGGKETLTITPNAGYAVPETIVVTGADYSYEDGAVELSNPVDDVVVTGACQPVGPQPGLTPFEDNDEFSSNSLIANINMSTADIADIVSKIADDTALISGTYQGTDFPIVKVGTDGQYGKGLVASDSILFLCEKLSDLDEGWQYDSETTPVDSQTGAVDLSQVVPFEVPITVYADGGWNGVILGKNL